MHSALKSIAHRPWPLPIGPWVMAQTWHDLLFAHWRVAPDVLARPSRPSYRSTLGMGVAGGSRPLPHERHSCPRTGSASPTVALPGAECSDLRHARWQAGSLLLQSGRGQPSGCLGGARLVSAPLFSCADDGPVQPEWVRYDSERYRATAEFRGRYRPLRPLGERGESPLARWLTERYCLYTAQAGRVYRAEIHHQSWPLEDAEAEIETNTVALAAGIPLPEVPPLLHFARQLEVLIWPLRRIR